jgi:AcrR family transcriptional regulator
VERRTRLLEAGREMFADLGYDVPLEAIAERAGVGIATLYRNFPTRADLKVALMEDGLARSRRTLEVLLGEMDADPEDALAQLSSMFVSLRLGSLIPIIVRDIDVLPEHLIAERRANLVMVGEVIDRAKAKGVVREDLTAVDFFAGLAMISRPQPALAADPMVAGTTSVAALTRRVLTIFLAGLRPDGKMLP